MEYLGEVLEASTLKFTAQARFLDQAPELGSIIKIENEAGFIYAVVAGAVTGSLEPNRRPGAYGLSREELKKQQPQIFELLKTDFSGLIVGHLRENRYYSCLPPRPAGIHSFVYQCTEEEALMVAGNFNFLRTLTEAKAEPGDELVAAALSLAAEKHSAPRTYLIEAGRELLKILRDDYDRFNSIMGRIRRQA